MTESTRQRLIKKARQLSKDLEQERATNQELREVNANLLVERDAAEASGEVIEGTAIEVKGR
jgi:hypothetical protein